MRPTQIRDFEMTNFKLVTILAFAMSVFVLTGCKNDDKVEVDEQGLTKDIRALIPDNILQGIIDLGMPIYGGNTPPDITGTFLCSPSILVSSNFNDGNKPGFQFNDVKIIYSEQNNKKLTIKVQQIENNLDGDGIGGFIVGKNKNFTVFVGLDNEDNHGHKNKTAMLYSGIMSDEGIKDLYMSLVMIDDGGDPDNNLIENGNARLVYDSDGLSERTTLADAPAKSPSQNIKGTSFETRLPGICFDSNGLKTEK